MSLHQPREIDTCPLNEGPKAGNYHAYSIGDGPLHLNRCVRGENELFHVKLP